MRKFPGPRRGRSAGVPVRTEPDSGAGACTAVSLRCVAVRFQLGGAPCQRHLVAAEGRGVLRDPLRTSAHHGGPGRCRRCARTGTRAKGTVAPWWAASADLARAHGRVADLRRDSTHKLTTGLAREYRTIVVEDLNVAGMTRNRRLARHIADANFGEIRRQLAYKTQWHGGQLIGLADRWFASSKTCSGCGAVKAKLALSERTYVCTACGVILDRDVNAAVNLAEYGRQVIAGSGPEMQKTGAEPGRKSSSGWQAALKRQPGSATAGQTGTVPPQDGTAT